LRTKPSRLSSRLTRHTETTQSFAKHGVTDIAASIQDDGAALSPASVFNGLAAQVVFFKAFIVGWVLTSFMQPQIGWQREDR
jgi:hypothetical protein